MLRCLESNNVDIVNSALGDLAEYSLLAQGPKNALLIFLFFRSIHS